MKKKFTLPKDSENCNLADIARNIPGITLTSVDKIPDREFLVEKDKQDIHWSYSGNRLIFAYQLLKKIEIDQLENARETFLTIVFTFYSHGELMSYRMVTSHKLEADWLKKTAHTIGNLLDCEPVDLTNISN